MADGDRNLELKALTEVITAGILREINLRWKTTPPPNFMLIMVAGDMMENAYATDQHKPLFDAMAEIVGSWIEDGFVKVDESETPRPARPVTHPPRAVGRHRVSTSRRIRRNGQHFFTSNAGVSYTVICHRHHGLDRSLGYPNLWWRNLVGLLDRRDYGHGSRSQRVYFDVARPDL